MKKKSSPKAAKAKAQQAQQLLAAMQNGSIDPELQASQISMQPVDGYVNPYHAMGTVAPNIYSPGNMVNGYGPAINFVNPEA